MGTFVPPAVVDEIRRRKKLRQTNASIARELGLHITTVDKYSNEFMTAREIERQRKYYLSRKRNDT